MPTKTSKPNRWKDGSYVQVYVTANSRTALRIGAAVHGHSIPEEVERLLAVDKLHAGHPIQDDSSAQSRSPGDLVIERKARHPRHQEEA